MARGGMAEFALPVESRAPGTGPFGAEACLARLRNGRISALNNPEKPVTNPIRASFLNEPVVPAVSSDYELFVASLTGYAMFLLDAEGRVATWGPGAEEQEGFKAEEILGQPFSTFFRPEDVALGQPQA